MRLTSGLKFKGQLSVHRGDGADVLGQKELVLVESLHGIVHDAWHLDRVTTSLAHSDVKSSFCFVLEFFHGLIYDTVDW